MTKPLTKQERADREEKSGMQRLTEYSGHAIIFNTLEEARAAAWVLQQFGVLKNLAIPERSPFTGAWRLSYRLTDHPQDVLWVAHPRN